MDLLNPTNLKKLYDDVCCILKWKHKVGDNVGGNTGNTDSGFVLLENYKSPNKMFSEFQVVSEPDFENGDGYLVGYYDEEGELINTRLAWSDVKALMSATPILGADYVGTGNYSGVNVATGLGVYKGRAADIDDNEILHVNDIFYYNIDHFFTVIVEGIKEGLQAVQTYSGVWSIQAESTGNDGIPLANNNVVIHKGLHYPVVNATAFDGTSPDVNTTAYGAALPFQTNLGYVAVDEVAAVRWNETYERVPSTSGSEFFIEKTKDEVDQIISDFKAGDGPGLIPGVTYKITGTTGQSGLYVDLFLKADTPNKLALGGEGLFYNADYQFKGIYDGVNAATGIGVYGNIWDIYTAYPIVGTIVKFSGVFYVSTVEVDGANISSGTTRTLEDEGFIPVNQGIWSADKEATLVNNNVVIWNGKHYLVLHYNNFNGTNPSINKAAYHVFSPYSYNEEIYSIEVQDGYVDLDPYWTIGSTVNFIDYSTNNAGQLEVIDIIPEIVNGGAKLVYKFISGQHIILTGNQSTSINNGSEGYASNAIHNSELLITNTYENLGYIPSLDIIKYDYENDWLMYREDSMGNKVGGDFDFISSWIGENPIRQFQWENNLVISNTIDNSVCWAVNNQGSFINNILQQQSQWYLENTGDYHKGTIQNCTVSNNKSIQVRLDVDETIENRIYDGRPLVYQGLLFQSAIADEAPTKNDFKNDIFKSDSEWFYESIGIYSRPLADDINLSKLCLLEEGTSGGKEIIITDGYSNGKFHYIVYNETERKVIFKNYNSVGTLSNGKLEDGILIKIEAYY